MKNSLLILLVAGFVLVSACSSIPKPNLINPYKTPGSVSEKEQKIIANGSSLIEQERFQEAIAKFREVLKDNPDNVEAIFKTARSYSNLKQYDSSFKYISIAMLYESEFLSELYNMLALNYEDLDYTEYAISVFEKGNEIRPSYKLCTNMGFLFLRLGEHEKAEPCLIDALKLNPNYSNSNMFLSTLYMETGRRFSSIFASLKFLTQEPKSRVSFGIFKSILYMAFAGVHHKNGVKHIVLSGDSTNGFYMMDSSLSGKIINGDFLYDLKKGNRLGILQEILNIILPLINDERKDFVGNHYLKFFKSLYSEGYHEVLAYYVLQGFDNSEVRYWLLDHKDQVRKFEEWMKEYEY